MAGGRYRQLVRCLRLLRLVRGRYVLRIDTLANQLRVSERTIRRDLTALVTAGEDVPGWLAHDKDLAS